MTTSSLAAETTEPDYLHAPTKRKGLAGWIFSTDHKRIALLYLATMMLFFLVAVILGGTDESGIIFDRQNDCRSADV